MRKNETTIIWPFRYRVFVQRCKREFTVSKIRWLVESWLGFSEKFHDIYEQYSSCSGICVASAWIPLQAAPKMSVLNKKCMVRISWTATGPPIIPLDAWSWRGPNPEFLSGRFLGVFWEFYPDFPQAPADRQFLSGPGIRPSEISDMSWKMSAFTSEVHLQLQEVKCNIFCFSTDVWGNLGKRCQVQSENHSVLAHFVLFRVLSSRQGWIEKCLQCLNR